MSKTNTCAVSFLSPDDEQKNIDRQNKNKKKSLSRMAKIITPVVLLGSVMLTISAIFLSSRTNETTQATDSMRELRLLTIDSPYFTVDTSPPSHSPSFVPTIAPSLKPTTPLPSSSPIKRKDVTFYIMGDIPYNSDEEKVLERYLKKIPEDGDFLIHVGDFQKASNSYCDQSSYRDVRNLLLKSKIPVFITPGDNDFNKCPVPNRGLAYFRAYFGEFDKKWDHDMEVSYQRNRVENVAFLLDFVLVIGCNLVGKPVHSKSEWEDRFDDNIDWVEDTLDKHEGKFSSIIIFGHGPMSGDREDFFEPLTDILQDLEIPVMYFHGSNHYFDLEMRPFGSGFLNARVQVDKGVAALPLKVMVRDESPTFRIAKNW